MKTNNHIVYCFLITTIMLLCINTAALSQSKSDRLKPQWMSIPPIPTNNTFIYEIHTGKGETLEQARQSCLDDIVSNSSLGAGSLIVSDYTSTDKSDQTIINGNLNEVIKRCSVIKTQAKGSEIKVYILGIDEYWERDETGKYYVTKLYAKSELKEHPLFDSISFTPYYGTDGWWRSFIPGCRQFYKEDPTKGIVIIGMESVGVAGIITSYAMRSSCDRLMAEDPKHKTDYQDSKDTWTNIMWGCIGYTAIVYLYNIGDALFAKGGRRIIVYPQQYNNGVGMSVEYKF